MDRTQEIALIERFGASSPAERFTYAAASMRNPASHYTDPEWFDDEMAVLFRAKPLFVGLSVECSEPGAHLVRSLGGIYIAVVRQRDGSLRAFVNMCRHRGASLFAGDGIGNSRRIVCPYHAWTYDMDGQLLNRPNSYGTFDDVSDACNLMRRAVVEKHGLIYVDPTSDAAFDVDEQLHGTQREFKGYGIETAHPVETRVSTWKMNWKLLLDAFLEPYHVPYLHQKTINPVFLPHQFFDSFGPLPRVVGLRRTVVAQTTTEPREEWTLFPHAAAVYVLLPNALMTYQGDHLETWRIEPIDVETTRAYTTIFAPEPPATDKARDYWLRNLEVLCDVSFNEDFPMQEQIQRNLKSGAMTDVFYGRIEPALVHYHTSVNEAVEVYRLNKAKVSA
jgi:phenylpropionate dioxygenase-like ring-hydroxylating dioxygenase large terminal subunit